MSTFEPWPKIPRWNRQVVITEKIDGTNAAIIIEPVEKIDRVMSEGKLVTFFEPAQSNCLGIAHDMAVFAQSRNRLIRPGVGKEAANDNYGFAAWVQENAEELVKLLGPGRHYGEWYGKGIARNYGLGHRRFALFNTTRWNDDEKHGLYGPQFQLHPTLPVDVVPVLGIAPRPEYPAYEGETYITDAIADLQRYGSALVPGFMRPEGVVLYHTAAGQAFKVLLEGDELPKGVFTRRERELLEAAA